MYVLFAQLLVGDPEGGASGEDAMDFYGLLLVSFWMSIVLLLDRWVGIAVSVKVSLCLLACST